MERRRSSYEAQYADCYAEIYQVGKATLAFWSTVDAMRATEVFNSATGE